MWCLPRSKGREFPARLDKHKIEVSEMKQKKRREKKQMPAYVKAAIIFLVVVTLGVGVCMFCLPTFRVTEVYCEGNHRVSGEELVAAAEVPLGKNVLLQNLSGIRNRVAQIPMVEEVKVRRVFPDKIRIWIQERVPAAYLYDGENSCTVIDIKGRILEIIEGKPVAQMKEFYTPVPVEKPEKEEKEQKETEEEKVDEETEVEETPKEKPESPALKEPKRTYSVPFVVGLKPHKPEVGKTVGSKEREKLATVQKTFSALEDAKILERSTYMDVTDLSDVILVVENRLEIHMGELRNIEYRCQFLATVIREKISATEEVIMDYRGNDIYVRQPDDGKEWIVPKTEETEENDEESETE